MLFRHSMSIAQQLISIYNTTDIPLERREEVFLYYENVRDVMSLTLHPSNTTVHKNKSNIALNDIKVDQRNFTNLPSLSNQ